MRYERNGMTKEGGHGDSSGHYWAHLRNQLPAPRFWTRWNLAYTKRVLSAAPNSTMASALLRCWRPRIQRALRKRFGMAE